jgi:hypothetical protein
MNGRGYSPFNVSSLLEIYSNGSLGYSPSRRETSKRFEPWARIVNVGACRFDADRIHGAAADPTAVRIWASNANDTTLVMDELLAVR